MFPPPLLFFRLPPFCTDALDWASRMGSLLHGLPIAIITATPGPYSGIRAYQQWVLASNGFGTSLHSRGLLLGSIYNSMADGEFNDSVKEQAAAFAAGFTGFVSESKSIKEFKEESK